VLVIIAFAFDIRLANDAVPSDISGAIDINFGMTQDEIRLKAMTILAGAFSLFWFLAYLRRRLRETEGEAGWLADVAYGGGLLTGAMLLMFTSLGLAASVLLVIAPVLVDPALMTMAPGLSHRRIGGAALPDPRRAEASLQ
jgi:hypothetical protein